MDTIKRVDEAAKLDGGKRKLSLIHPSMLMLMLKAKTPQDMFIKDAMVNLSRAAHASAEEEVVAYIESAVANLLKYYENNKAAIEELSRAMEYGERKPEYGRNNWKKGMQWSRLLDAAMRHGLSILDGELDDKDSGNTHFAHMLGSIHMLLGNVQIGIGTNDLC